MSNKFVVALFNLIQLLTLYLCLYSFTSTMPALPWYEPLTMGAYFMTFFTMFLQGVVIAYYFVMFKEEKILKRNLRFSLVNIMILLVIAFIPDIFNEQLFYDLAYLAVIIESILLLLFIYLSFMNLRKVS